MTPSKLRLDLERLRTELDRFETLPPAARARIPNLELTIETGRAFLRSTLNVLELSSEDDLAGFLASPQATMAESFAESVRVAINAALALTRPGPPSNPNKKQFRH